MENLQLPHKLTLTERKHLTASGVTEVVSFDENAVVLRTCMGSLEIQGRELALKKLSIDGGEVAVDGHICALYYEEPRSENGFWGRFFK